MSPRRQLVTAVAAAVALATAGRAQAAPGMHYTIDGLRGDSQNTADFDEHRCVGGFVFRVPDLDLEIRGLNSVLLTDRDSRALIGRETATGLPRRGVEPPAPRRRLSPREVRARIEQTLRTFGNDVHPAETAFADRALDLVRFLYFEGGITVFRGGVEMLRCERLWISPIEDHIVVEEVELRYATEAREGPVTVVVRGPRLEKRGARWTGRDLAITTCTADAPHVAWSIGEAEIIERETELEIFSRGQHLQLGGVSVLPLPDAHFFTGSQTHFPIKRARAGYSGKEGAELEVVFGLPWNSTGGFLHELLTGRPADEFRGDWELGVGFVEERGAPLRPALDYRAPGLYEGRTEAFWLADQGEDIREIRTHYDGSPIDAESRGMVRTQNRFFLGDNTHFDVQAFTASDPAVLSEFHPGDYRSRELPETSGYLHHQTGNHLITFGARTNLDAFSYRDNRALAERFIEELPVFTWHWLGEKLGETPWETPIVLDAATELGQRRSDYDDRATTRIADRTFRADQLLELSAPFALGVVNVRPWFATRGTWFDNSLTGEDESRVALEGGVQLGTRMSRVFQWTDELGSTAVRHVMAPRVSFMNRLHVDDDPGEFFQFDAVDALTEQQLVRIELRNLFEHTGPAPNAAAPSDFLMLDLAQDLYPDATRDNAGEELGLFYYDALVRPQGEWLPFRDFSFALYGDHDWQEGLRTLDTEMRFGPLLGLTWTLEYRTDRYVDGAVGVSAQTRLYDRWSLFASSMYDLEQDDWLTYGFGLQRNDHDWAIALSGGYDPFSDETTFRLEFIPTLPGMSRRRADRFGRHLHDADFATRY